MFFITPDDGRSTPRPTVTPAAGLRDRLGRPLRDLRISVTDRCNFRCHYCMPSETFGDRYEFLPRPELLTWDEIARVTRLFAGLGTRKIRITGGEPLLRPDLPDLIARLSAIPGIEDLALTTNGSLLEGQAGALRAAGLHRVTVSLDSVDGDVFRRMSGGRGGVEGVLAGIAAAERAGLTPIKINCVVQRGVNDHTVVDLARHFKGTPHIVRFIEFMDVGTLNGWDMRHVCVGQEIVNRIHREMPLRPAWANYRGEVANRYVYEDGEGEIGIITSVSDPFCGDCTRARLSADGRLVTCLFATGGVDLRAALRDGTSDADIHDLVCGVWLARDDRYSEERAELRSSSPCPTAGPRIEMYQIGG